MKKYLLIALGFTLWLGLPSHSFAAIAFEATASTTKNMAGTSGTITVSNLGGSAANRIAVMCVRYANNSGGTDSINSATYGGTSMTAFGASITNGAGVSRAFYLLNPPTGTQTGSASYTSNITDPIMMSVTTYTGVDQVTGVYNYTTNTGSSLNPAVTVSSVTGEVVFDCAGAGAGSGTHTTTIGGSGTQRAKSNATANGDNVTGGAGEWVGAASVTTAWTLDSILTWSDLGWSMIPASAATPAKPKWVFGPFTFFFGGGKWIFN